MPGSKNRNKETALALLMLVAGMTLLAFASVPLYKLFCQATGFAGTTMRATKLPDHVLNQEVTVDFSTLTDSGLPWSFAPGEPKLTLRIGESRLTHYHVKNNSDHAITAQATYNVVPLEMGSYLNKTQCFCFQNLTLAAGEEANLPVAFFIDPAVADDPYLKKIDRITLSYTFFEVKNPKVGASKVETKQ